MGQKNAFINAYKKAYEEGFKAGEKFSAKAVSVWLCLALREEPFKFGGKRLQRVLDNLHKYSNLTIEGKTDIEEQRDFIRRTTGINILYESQDDFAYTIDTEVVEDLDFKEE